MPETETRNFEIEKARILSALRKLRDLTDDKPTLEQSKDFEIKNRFKYIGNFFVAVCALIRDAINQEMISDPILITDGTKFISTYELDGKSKIGPRELITEEDVKEANSILDKFVKALK